MPEQDIPPRWRQRLIPKTVLGISMLVLAAALGSALSGAVLYAYYDYRLNQNEERVDKFVSGFDERFKRATDVIAYDAATARNQIREELKPLEKIAAPGGTLAQLTRKVSPSLWFVNTLNEEGAPSVGTAFVVASDTENAMLITSFSTVKAATRAPGPDVMVRQGDENMKATLWTWQEDKDLALLVIPKAHAPRLPWAPGSPQTKVGERVFALSGYAGSGAAITQGQVADLSGPAVQHDAPVGVQFQGGPLVNSNGEVLAVASRSYFPGGFTTDQVTFAVPIRLSCERVLKCPNGDPGGPGDKR